MDGKPGMRPPLDPLGARVPILFLCECAAGYMRLVCLSVCLPAFVLACPHAHLAWTKISPPHWPLRAFRASKLEEDPVGARQILTFRECIRTNAPMYAKRLDPPWDPLGTSPGDMCAHMSSPQG